MSKLTIKNGKFYRGEEEVKPEFGNTEQINLMAKLKKKQEALEGDGIKVLHGVTRTIRIVAALECLCSETVHFSAEAIEGGSDEIYDAIEGTISKCRGCGKRYEISVNEDGDLVVKKATNKKKQP